MSKPYLNSSQFSIPQDDQGDFLYGFHEGHCRESLLKQSSVRSVLFTLH